MKLIIDIDKKIIEQAKHYNDLPYDDYVIRVAEAIKNGIPLPKGHGRILDEKDILDTENNDGGLYDLVDMPEYIAGVKSIIKADKVERSE